MTLGPGAEIATLQRLHELPERSVVVDADGNVFCVQHHERFGGETWLSPFSDEYSVWVKADGSVSGPGGDAPNLPIVFTGIIAKTGG